MTWRDTLKWLEIGMDCVIFVHSSKAFTEIRDHTY